MTKSMYFALVTKNVRKQDEKDSTQPDFIFLEIYFEYELFFPRKVSIPTNKKE